MTIKRIKIVCLTLFSAFIGFCTLTNTPALKTAQAFTKNLPGGFTGAPSEGTCAIIGCHVGTVNLDGELLMIEPSSSSYDLTHELMITVKFAPSNTANVRWGFQLTAIDENGRSAGTLSPGSDNLTILTTPGGPTGERQYIEHNVSHDADGTFEGKTSDVQWTFKWQPPTNYFGPVLFYAAGCRANNNGKSKGDSIYTTRFVLNIDPDLLPVPVIEGLLKQGNKLFVIGRNFDGGALVLLNGIERPTAVEDMTRLRSKKAGKKIQPGDIVKVRNGSGKESNEVTYLPPPPE